MNWQEVCDHPSLKDLPFKIELDESGKIIMSPVKLYHSFFQGEIGFLLRTLLKDGKTLPECAIKSLQKSALKLFQQVTAKKKCWKKDAYILKLARKRFGFVMNRAKCSFLMCNKNYPVRY